MGLVAASSYLSGRSVNDGPFHFTAWLAAEGRADIRSAVLLANVNILRRHAPNAYLFANGFSKQQWLTEDIGDEFGYLQRLDVIELKRGVWFNPLDCDKPARAAVTAILEGDVLPFVHLLGYEEYGMLCLPVRRSLAEIDLLLQKEAPNRERVCGLLNAGGCVVTAVDEVCFRVYSFDQVFGQYFADAVRQ